MATPINVVSGIEDASEANDDKAIHLLMIGKPYVGKSTLVNALVRGKSTEGNAGPKTSKPLEPTTLVVHGVVFKVYDTQGIQLTTNKDEIIKKMKTILSNKFCIVVVCFRWDSRFDDECMKILELINSLSNDIWNKVIIALTRSDVLSPDWIDFSDEKKNDKIILKNKEWNNAIKKALSNFNVNDELVNEFKICNTSHTEIPTENHLHLLNWRENLVQNLFNVFGNSPGFWDVVKPSKVEFDFCSKPANIEKISEHTYSIGDIVYTIAPASDVSAGGGTVLGAIKDRDVVKPSEVEFDFCSKPANIEKKSEHTYSIGDVVYTSAPASNVSAGGGTVLGAIKDRDVVKPSEVEFDFSSKPANIEKKSEHTYSIGDVVYTSAPASDVSAGGGTFLGAIKDRVVGGITDANVGYLLGAGLGIILTAAILFYIKKRHQKHVLIILRKFKVI